MTATQHILADELYTGSLSPPQTNMLIEVAGGRIGSVSPAPDRLHDGTHHVAIAAPGFIDLQINGAADVQFNDEPTPDAIASITEGARQGGAAHILPTFITAPGDAWHQAIEACTDAMAQDTPGVLGLHLEGPFLSPQRPGIHPAHAIRVMTEADLERLEQADIPLLLTLAPEEQSPGFLKRLALAGIVLFAGHTIATAEQIEDAIADGLTGLTHLWNAMPPPQGRAPGPVGVALTNDALCAGIIADGYHVDKRHLKVAAAMMRQMRLILVTDAMRSYAGRETRFDLLGTPVTLKDGLLTGPDGTLAGAHLGMDDAVRYMIREVGVAVEDAIAMASYAPARAMGLEAELGMIAPGYRASMTFLDQDFASTGVMVDGTPFY